MIHLFLGIYKPVARNNGACMYHRLSTHFTAIHLQGLLHQTLLTEVSCRHTLYLPILHMLRRLTTIHIMVGKLGTHYHILHVESHIGTTRTPSADNHIGLIVHYHGGGPDSSIHLAYTTLMEHQSVIA